MALAGVWVTIGTGAKVRHRFYEASNWCYQVGVFISRSSGLVYQASRRMLWLMPAAQVGLLALFIAVAAAQVMSFWLLLPAFTAGVHTQALVHTVDAAPRPTHAP